MTHDELIFGWALVALGVVMTVWVAWYVLGR